MTRKDLGTSRWKALRKKILQRDQHTCYLCGDEATQVDHIQSIAQGGTDDIGNLAAICARCNSLKGLLHDKPQRKRETTTIFRNTIPPTRLTARISPPKPIQTEGNPFQ